MFNKKKIKILEDYISKLNEDVVELKAKILDLEFLKDNPCPVSVGQNHKKYGLIISVNFRRDFVYKQGDWFPTLKRFWQATAFKNNETTIFEV